MPRFNGLQLYYKLKAIDKDVKVIFLSALEATEEIMSIFPTLQPKDIITKPIEKVTVCKQDKHASPTLILDNWKKMWFLISQFEE